MPRPLLLDTHALLWWLLDSPELGAMARAAIADPAQRVLVSAASAWELATKQRLGKLPEAGDIVTHFSACLRKQRFEPLPISAEHALAAGQLPGPHRDPFDRMLMAQAQTERAAVVTTDPVFRDHGVAVVWSHPGKRHQRGVTRSLREFAPVDALAVVGWHRRLRTTPTARQWLRVPSQVPPSTAASPTPCHTVSGSPSSSTANSTPKIGTQYE